MFDVIIVGGGYAGLSAALQLGRARRDVLVIDAGERRNRSAAHAHGFLGHDGEAPDAIAARGRADVSKYETVRFLDGKATAPRAIADGFEVQVDGKPHAARRLILATGVKDELPLIPGLWARWGRSVFHCPYCHGYETERGRLGLLATGPHAAHHARLIAEWAAPGQMTVFLHGGYEPDAAARAELDAAGIALEAVPVAAIEGDPPGVTVRLADDRAVALAGLFAMPRCHPHGDFAAALGCALDENAFGAFYRVDMTRQTTVPGVFACGDIVTPAAIAVAVSDGVMAGVGAHRSLVFGLDKPAAR
ncbi:MAG: NAD(P)/FAD-dependent oxidoreductase [Myxococcales bacterium]|nr:NAD(P)/FAD-dependent oxidoreductase [Myxococcales bacterium]